MSTRKGIGYSPLTDKVYLGRQNKAKGMWIGEKEDITDDFLHVADQYFELDTIRTLGTESNDYLYIHVVKNVDSIDKVIKTLNKMKDELVDAE
jgi:hypothetical protein